MSPANLSAMKCSIARTLDVVGDRWTLLVLRNAFYGVRRFGDFQKDLGIARNVLTDRLTRLVDEGVLVRQRYEEHPPRDEYVLTEKGRDLLPVVLAMMRWGDTWKADPEPPVTVTHVSCGKVTQPTVACSECGGELRLDNVRASPIRVRGASEGPATLVGGRS